MRVHMHACMWQTCVSDMRMNLAWDYPGVQVQGEYGNNLGHTTLKYVIAARPRHLPPIL